MICEKCKVPSLVVNETEPSVVVEFIEANSVVEWRKEGQKKIHKTIIDVPFCSVCGSVAGDADAGSFINGFRAAASILNGEKPEFWLSRSADISGLKDVIEVVRHDYDTQKTLYRVK